MTHERFVSISKDHSSLPGHFPGNPVVPGVVILGEVIDALGRIVPGHVLTGLPSVKFVSPLKPGEPLTIRWDLEDAGVATFSCHVEARLVVRGTMLFRDRAEQRTSPQ